MSNVTIAHAVTLVILIMHIHHHLLETTTTVNQAIWRAHLSFIIYIWLILSGTVSSVKVSVAAMENLLHGSVWSYPIQQLMILRCKFAFLQGICKGGEPGDDIPVQLLELYIQ